MVVHQAQLVGISVPLKQTIDIMVHRQLTTRCDGSQKVTLKELAS